MMDLATMRACRDEFEKIALSAPAVGAALGGAVGATKGLVNAKPGSRLKGALLGGAGGAALGGAAGVGYKHLPQGMRKGIEQTADVASRF